MLTRRIIPCLDIKDGRTVKGTNFIDLRDAGDPVELGALYAEEGADEGQCHQHHHPRPRRFDSSQPCYWLRIAERYSHPRHWRTGPSGTLPRLDPSW